MDIKNDLVVLNYLKQNNFVENLKNDLIDYYVEHSCATRENVEAYLSANFTVGAMLEMLSKVGGVPPMAAAGSSREKKTAVRISLERKASGNVPAETVETAGSVLTGRIYESTRLYGKTVSYKNLKEVNGFEYGGFKFTKECPDLSGNDVVAVYLIGKNMNEVIDLMYVNLGTKLKCLSNGKTDKYMRYAYMQNISLGGGYQVSFCRMNNFTRGNVAIRDKRTGEIYPSIAQAAKAFGLSKYQMSCRLKKNDIEAERLK